MVSIDIEFLIFFRCKMFSSPSFPLFFSLRSLSRLPSFLFSFLPPQLYSATLLVMLSSVRPLAVCKNCDNFFSLHARMRPEPCATCLGEARAARAHISLSAAPLKMRLVSKFKLAGCGCFNCLQGDAKFRNVATTVRADFVTEVSLLLACRGTRVLIWIIWLEVPNG